MQDLFKYTTAGAFFSSAGSSVPSIAAFGIFCGLVVLCDWFLMVLYLPPLAVVYTNSVRTCLGTAQQDNCIHTPMDAQDPGNRKLKRALGELTRSPPFLGTESNRSICEGPHPSMGSDHPHHGAALSPTMGSGVGSCPHSCDGPIPLAQAPASFRTPATFSLCSPPPPLTHTGRRPVLSPRRRFARCG